MSAQDLGSAIYRRPNLNNGEYKVGDRSPAEQHSVALEALVAPPVGNVSKLHFKVSSHPLSFYFPLGRRFAAARGVSSMLSTKSQRRKRDGCTRGICIFFLTNNVTSNRKITNNIMTGSVIN